MIGNTITRGDRGPRHDRSPSACSARGSSRYLPLTVLGAAVVCALGTVCAVAIGVPAPLAARADVAQGDGSGHGGVDGEEITAEVEAGGGTGSGGGGSSVPNPDRCSWKAVMRIDPSSGASTEVTRRIGSKTQVLMSFECLGPPARSGRKWITRATGGGSSARRRLPAPDVSTAPPPDRGVVNVGTWFWVSRSVWKPWSVTASVATPAGPVTVTTTARPSRLILDPGDGRPPVRCAGPGHAWNAAFGDDVRTGCMYTWRRASTALPGGAYRASLTIQWKVTWRSSLGASGRLPDIRTSTPFMAHVREIQAVASR